MWEYELLERAFAMPLTNPAYPPGLCVPKNQTRE
jgi:acetoacetate decarboxylase